MDTDKIADSARTEEFLLHVSPQAMRLLTHPASQRDMSCEALAREYLSRGMVEDRLRLFAETATQAVEAVVRDLAPDKADEIVAAVNRRFSAGA